MAKITELPAGNAIGGGEQMALVQDGQLRNLSLWDLAEWLQSNPVRPYDVAALFDGGIDGAWFDMSAADNLWRDTGKTTLVAADGDEVQLVADLTDHGNDLTYSNEPGVWIDTGLHCPTLKVGGASVKTQFANTDLVGNFTTQDLCGGCIIEKHGNDLNRSHLFSFEDASGNTMGLLYDAKATMSYRVGGDFVDTGIPPSANRMTIVWRATADNFILRINGQEYARGAPLPLYDLTRVYLAGNSGGNQFGQRVEEFLFRAGDMGESEMLALEAYLRAKAGPIDSSKTLHMIGDSILAGTNSETYQPVSYRLAGVEDWHIFPYCFAGSQIRVPKVSAATIAAQKGASQAVAIVFMGTNDFMIGGKTGPEVYGYISDVCTLLKGAGIKIVLGNIPQLPGVDAEVQACNALLDSDHSFADVLVDLRAQFPDNTDPAFYNADDPVHGHDGWHAAAGALFQAGLDQVLA